MIMIKQLLLLVGLVTFSSCQGTSQKKKETETKTEVEQETTTQEEWISLFNGETLDGWHQYNGDKLVEEWSVTDGVLTFEPKKDRKWGDGGKNKVTDHSFNNFILSIDWNVSESGNRGIFWGVREGEEFGEPYVTGPEIQILDNERHPDAKVNPKFHQAGALYDLVQPSADVCNPAGEWNHVLLTVDHNANEGNVVFNGTEIVRFPLSGEAWEELVNNSKFKGWKAFDTQGNLWLVGYSQSEDIDFSSNEGDNDVALLQLDQNLFPQQHFNLGGNGLDIAHAVLPLEDRKLLVVGTSESQEGLFQNNQGEKDIFVALWNVVLE